MDFKELVLVDKTNLAGIPCLYVRPNLLSGRFPTVIFYHGWHSRKENHLFLARILAMHGFGVVLPDAVGHGERGCIDYDNYEVLVQNFWNIIFQGVKESDVLIKSAAEALGIDSRKIAVMGSSMGGFIASGVFARNKDINCLININGACAWENVETLFRQEDGRGLADENKFAAIRDMDPYRFREQMYPRPILLMHGDSDTQIPVDTQRYFYKEIESVYQHKPENIRYIEVPKLNHHKTLDMVEEACSWLGRWM